MTKTTPGNFFEDFRLGQTIGTRRRAPSRPATSRSTTRCYGARFAPQSSDAFASAIGYPRSPLDDLLVFHIVFGKTVPDISLNAVANLGYADCRFLHAVYPGDTLTAVSEVIGLKENSSRKTGVVYVRSTGFKQDGAKVLEYVRWVMVRKRDEAAAAPGDLVPRPAEDASIPRRSAAPARRSSLRSYDFALAGSAASLRRLSGRREDRPRRRHDGRGSRAPDGDAALSEHRARALQPVHRRARTASAAG